LPIKTLERTPKRCQKKTTRDNTQKRLSPRGDKREVHVKVTEKKGGKKGHLGGTILWGPPRQAGDHRGNVINPQEVFGVGRRREQHQGSV